MPANLPPDYHRAEQRYREAISPEDKIEALEEMMRIMPKHKGTDHLRADHRKRLSQHKKELQEGKKKGAKTSSTLDKVDKQGAGQVVLVGLPNAGKTSIVAHFTKAQVEPTDYPFATFKPTSGMMHFENIQIQLVDMPPVSPEHTEYWAFNIIRNTDLVLLVVDLSQPAPEEQVLELTSLLEEKHLLLTGDRETESPDLSTAIKPTYLVATKFDAPNAESGLASLQEEYGDDFPILTLSVQSGHNTETLPEKLFEALHVLRIYTKAPGKQPDMDQPYTLPIGSTVFEVAETVHRDFSENLRFARIWGADKYDGQQVKQDHVVSDEDVIELH
ncbi:MAG: 50S ribosome-binding GTPase [bacterium]|nr:50S ribosome-binding GTPase [bacterium]